MDVEPRTLQMRVQHPNPYTILHHEYTDKNIYCILNNVLLNYIHWIELNFELHFNLLAVQANIFVCIRF